MRTCIILVAEQLRKKAFGRSDVLYFMKINISRASIALQAGEDEAVNALELKLTEALKLPPFTFGIPEDSSTLIEDRILEAPQETNVVKSQKVVVKAKKVLKSTKVKGGKVTKSSKSKKTKVLKALEVKKAPSANKVYEPEFITFDTCEFSSTLEAESVKANQVPVLGIDDQIADEVLNALEAIEDPEDKKSTEGETFVQLGSSAVILDYLEPFREDVKKS